MSKKTKSTDEIYLNTEDYPPVDESTIQVLSNLEFNNLAEYYKHTDLAKYLEDKEPIVFNIVINSLDPKLRNRKEFVQKEKKEIWSKFQEQIWTELEKEYGKGNGVNEVYGAWLDELRDHWNREKYSNIDEQIMKEIVEPKYKEKIFKRFKNHDKLMQPRSITERERYYKLPKPLHYIDWRTSYDNLFIFKDDKKKYVARGLSGNSGARETKSRFAYAYCLLNQSQPITSYFLLYSSQNKLLFMRKYDSLCITSNDIGSNYHENIEKNIFNETLFASFDYSRLFSSEKLIINNKLYGY